jgi:hypothetical protein
MELRKQSGVSFKNVLENTLIATTEAGYIKSQTSKSKRESLFVSKKFTLEAIVQVARSLGTKSLDSNRNFSLRSLSNVFTTGNKKKRGGFISLPGPKFVYRT